MIAKRYILILLCIYMHDLVNAQTFFSEESEHLIYYSPDIAPTAVCVGDIEGDGDQDILSFFNQKFRLYLHTDGQGTFEENEVISDSIDWIFSVFMADLNGDGKEDILAASYNKDRIVWYENEGNLSFGIQRTITDKAMGASSLFAADLDRDGDLDVVSASIWDNKVAWYENTGGGIFGDQQIISNEAEGARDLYVTDLNGDEFPDVISASMYDHKIAWYENMAGNSFGEQIIVTESAARAVSVYAADLDGDLIPDLLSASSWDNKIAWYKNEGDGIFGVQRVISTSMEGAQSVFAADLDEDGDPDVLSASLQDNKIAWYENNGTGDFGLQRPVTHSADGPGFVHATDVDGDGYRDIVSASTDFKISWYENSLPLNILVNPRDSAVLPGQHASFSLMASSATAYQWQCNEGEGYTDLTNDETYAGAASNQLDISGARFDQQGNHYRCLVVNGQDSLYSGAALLIIVDSVPPIITSVHPDTILQANWNCVAEIPDFMHNVEASDNSYSALEITQTPVPWSKISAPGVEITLTASDGAGNQSQVTFNVDVVDHTPPDITTSTVTFELEKNNDGHYIVPDLRDSIEVTDNCSEFSAVTITQEPLPFEILPDTTIKIDVTVAVLDEAGNGSQVIFKLYTVDQTPPEIHSIHPDAVVEGNHQCLAYLPDFTGEVDASDNVNDFAELVITQSPGANTVISGQENMVTLWVRDGAGNEAMISFNVAVSNPIAIQCINDQIVHLEEGQTTYTVSGDEFDPSSVEFYCGIPSLTNNINGDATLYLAGFPPGTTNVVWTLVDGEGNMAQCSYNVIVHKAVGIEPIRKHGISVFPNPTGGDIFIESSTPVQRLRVLDLQGRVILDRLDVEQEGNISLALLDRGIYILTVETGRGDYYRKIVKE